MECNNIVESYLSELKNNFECRRINGMLAVITPYLYPDNDLIEVFIEEISENRIRIGDLGETLRHLESQGFDVLGNKLNRHRAEQIASRVHAEIQQGKILKEGKPEDIGELIFDVICAAKGIGDLIYLSRAYEPATFNDEVANLFVRENIPFERDYHIKGLSDKKYTVEFRVIKPSVLLLKTLSPTKETGLTRRIDSVFRVWSDINGDFDQNKKISIMNDIEFKWKPHDIKLLERVSDIVYWSDKEKILYRLK